MTTVTAPRESISAEQVKDELLATTIALIGQAATRSNACNGLASHHISTAARNSGKC